MVHRRIFFYKIICRLHVMSYTYISLPFQFCPRTNSVPPIYLQFDGSQEMMDTQTSDISQWSAQQMRNMTGSTPQLPLQGHIQQSLLTKMLQLLE